MGADGGGNIDADPDFLSDPDDGGDGWGNDNDDFGNLRLHPGSPSIDTGTNWGCPATDLDGNPRPVNVLCDMGAYEFQNTPPDAVDDGGAYFSTENDTPFWTISVLSNDTDPDGDILAVDSFDASAILGTVTDLGYGVFGYDPNGQFDYLGAGEQAADTFTYIASDGNGGTDTATVTITITGKSPDCQCLFLPEVMDEE